MNPGRELDALVAEKVMGRQVEWASHHDDNGGSVIPWIKRVEGDIDHHESRECPRYSTDLAAAWEVVEKMREQKRSVSVLWENGEKSAYSETFWGVEISEPYDFVARFRACAGSAPHAICLAALKAVGHEVSP